MTLAELVRQLESKRRIYKQQLREKAMFDYTLANLIGISVSRVYNSDNALPDISEAYPDIYTKEEIEGIKAEREAELQALRFEQFAISFNKGVHS